MEPSCKESCGILFWVNGVWRWVTGMARNRLLIALTATLFIGMMVIFNGELRIANTFQIKTIGHVAKLSNEVSNEQKVPQVRVLQNNISMKSKNSEAKQNIVDANKDSEETVKMKDQFDKEEDFKLKGSDVVEFLTSTEDPTRVPKVGDFKDHFVFKKDHSSICGEDNGKSLPLLIIVTTAVNKIDSRDAIRNTWGGYAKTKGAQLVFLIGKTTFSDVQDYVDDEDKTYNDIIQADFIDNYANLTLKSVSLMKWVSERCSNVPYVLKTDDDMIINVDAMMKFLKSRKSDTKSIFGKVAKKWKPHRVKLNKYYVSYEEYNETMYPDFTTGPAYIFTGDSAKLIYEESLSHSFLFLEDVLLTGIVAKKVGIKRWHHPRMKNVRLKVTYCLFRKIITSHKHTPEEIETLWKEVNRTGVTCPPDKVVKRSKRK